MSDLHSWWASAQRPLARPDELAFYEAIPAAFRSTCLIKSIFLPRVFPQTDAASCFVAFAPGADDDRWVYYHRYATAGDMNAAYARRIVDLGVSSDTGACPAQLPAEGLWSRNGAAPGGRQACAIDDGDPTITWTTDELRILGETYRLGEPIGGGSGSGVESMQELYDWWEAEAGPVVVK